MADHTAPQEELWDDSDLLTSWNEAFAEYKKYHSIAVKGGKIEAATTSNVKGLTNGGKPSFATTTANQAQDDTADSDEYVPSLGQASKNGETAYATDSTYSVPAVGTAMPQALAATVQDDNMKNLMMSWYYAGYYTGLHEGKQQGYASALQQRQQGG